MSYWSLLEQAQRRLAAGELLAAERLLLEARAERSRSRLRAPVSEKAVEPMMRWARRVLRGAPEQPAAAPLFTQRADALESDLRAAAQLRLEEASTRLAARWEALTTDEVARVAQLLQLHCHGELFKIPDELLWPLLRAYLNGCGRHLIPPDPDLTAAVGDVGIDGTLWLAGFAHGLLQESVLDLAPLAPWLIARLTRPGLPAAHAARWRVCALAARLSLLLPDGAPAALQWARTALSEAEPCDESRALLRLAAGLMCNEARVAVPAATEVQLLGLHPLARRLQAPWPPDDLASLLRRRGADARGAQVAALAWDDAGSGRIAVVRLVDGQPADALLVELQEPATDERAAFARGPVQARADVDAWLAPGAPVLCDRTPPASVAALVADRPLLQVSALEQALPESDSVAPEVGGAAPPRALHPALSDAPDPATLPWQPLLAAARGLAPRVRNRAWAAPLASVWGRANVRALADAGLQPLSGLAEALALLVPVDESSDPDVALQRVPAAVSLRWPPLRGRAWPAAGSASRPRPSASVPVGDALVLGAVDASTLAGWAGQLAPVAIVMADMERAHAVAGEIAAHGLAHDVTVVPTARWCAEPFLQLLDRWIDEAVTSPERALDVLWLYHALARAPEGDVARWLEGVPRARVQPDVQAALLRAQRGCSESCRLRYEGGCFGAQFDERVGVGSIWIRVQSGEGAPRHASTWLVDDLVRWIPGQADELAEAAWDGMSRWVRAAARTIVCADAAAVAEPLAEALSGVLPDRRALQLQPWPGERPPVALSITAPGYEPGALLLGEEADLLVHTRAAGWLQKVKGARLWLAPGADAREWVDGERATALTGAAATPSVEVAVVPLLSGPGASHAGVSLLRLAMAATHARAAVACLDPRLATVEGVQRRAALFPVGSDPLGGAHAAELLDRAAARRLPRWRRPLDAQRLAATWELLLGAPSPDPRRLQAFASAVEVVARNARVAVGGARDSERVLLATVLARLAAEARDGGPLRVRTVIWLDEHAPPLDHRCGVDLRQLGQDAIDAPGAGALQDALLAAESGAVQLLAMPARALGLPLVREWAARSTEVAWVLPDADRALREHPAYDIDREQALGTLGTLPAEQGPLVIGLLDADEPSAGGPLDAVARALGAQLRVVAREPELRHAWKMRRETLIDPPWTCRSCGLATAVRHPYDLCTGCGASLLHDVHDEDRARRALLSEVSRWLARNSTTDPVVAVAPTARERDELQHLLGVDAAALAETPLLSGHAGDGQVYPVQVVAPEDLWTGPIPDGLLVLTALPRRSTLLRCMLDRLAARGRVQGSVLLLDHPLSWGMATPLPGGMALAHAGVPAGWRWAAPRVQVEFRLDEALAALERGMRADDGSPNRALGPAGSALHAAWSAPLVTAVEGWTPPRLRGGGAALGAEGARERMAHARRRAVAWIDRAVVMGLRFDATAAVVLRLDRIERETATVHASLAFMRWLVDEGLLQCAEASPTVAGTSAHLTDDGEERWLVAMRASAAQAECALPEWPAPREAPDPAPAASPVPLVPGSWIVGAPGAGKTTQLLQVATGAGARSTGALVLVPGGVALLRCAAIASALPWRIEVATGEELALSFLRSHHRRLGFQAPPRLLPESGGIEGENVRKRLLMETCRRYALAAGRAPSLDLVELRRIVEGVPAELTAAAEGEGALDVPLLRRCAAEARAVAGWMHRDELCAVTRRWLAEQPQVAQAWRDRYPRVLVDDVHAFDAQELDLIEQLFPAAQRWTTADPALLPSGHPQRGAKGLTQSHRLGRDLARAASAVLVRELRVSGAVQSGRRQKGRIVRRRGFNLQACLTAIEELLPIPDRDDRRVGIVARSNEDLAWLAARLREKELVVWPAVEVARRAAPGPRELLAVLLLSDGGRPLAGEERDGLESLLLRVAGEFPAGAGGPRSGDARDAAVAVTSRAESYLLQVAAVAEALERVDTLGDAAGILRRTRLLDRLLEQDAVAGRLDAFVEGQRERPWHACARETDPAALIDPLGAGPRVWLLLPGQLAGAEFDDLIHLCTGYEALELHYRVLARASDTLAVLYSEIDPLETFA